MISIQIDHTKPIMQQLFLADYFDAFLLSEAVFTTFNTFHIDGKLHKDYYTQEELTDTDLGSQSYSTWKQVKAFCYSLIKGTHTPLSFKIVFRLSPANTEKLLKQQQLSFSQDDIDGLYLNLHFQSQTLTCTTGTSLKTFTLDKTLDHAWDDLVKKYLSSFC